MALRFCCAHLFYAGDYLFILCSLQQQLSQVGVLPMIEAAVEAAPAVQTQAIATGTEIIAQRFDETDAACGLSLFRFIVAGRALAEKGSIQPLLPSLAASGINSMNLRGTALLAA